jgi:hypothetical protein
MGGCALRFLLAGDVLRRNRWGDFRLGRAAGNHFVPGGFEIGVEGVKRVHGHLCAPGFHLSLRPASVQSDRPGDVFRKGMPVIAFADENVADKASGAHVENPTAGLSVGIG